MKFTSFIFVLCGFFAMDLVAAGQWIFVDSYTYCCGFHRSTNKRFCSTELELFLKREDLRNWEREAGPMVRNAGLVFGVGTLLVGSLFGLADRRRG